MKNGRTDRDWAIVAVMTFIAGALLVWALMSEHPDDGQRVLGSQWPAWVQAIGSVGAILVAAYIPIRVARQQLQRQEREEAYRAKSLAFVIRPVIGRMISSVSTAKYRWSKCPEEYDDDQVVEFLVVPDELSSRLLKLHVLGDAGIAIQRAIVAFESVRSGVFTQYTHWRYGGMYYDFDTGEEFELEEPANVDEIFDKAFYELRRANEQLEEVLAL